MPRLLSEVFGALADDIDRFADLLEDTMNQAVVEVAEAALPGIVMRWPRDTGYSAEQWRAGEASTGVAFITNDADYSSFVFQKGDEDHQPIYPEIIAEEVAIASDMVDFDLTLHDATEKYWGKEAGKYGENTPKELREAYLEVAPELVRVGTVSGEFLFPTEEIEGGRGGTVLIRG